MLDRIKDVLSSYIQDTQMRDLSQVYISLECEKAHFPELYFLLTDADALAKAEEQRRHSEGYASFKTIH